MNKQTLNTIAYAQNVISFIFLDFSINNFINRIYLYGSAVRGELTSESDIDIFIDCDSEKEKSIERVAKAALSKFYQSKDFEKWKLLKITYPFSINAGNLLQWQLKTSILAEGILLYSKKAEIVPAERNVLFTYILPKKKNHYLHLTRRLFGRKEKGYKDTGLLGEVNGQKLSAQVIIVQKENQQTIERFFQKEEIDYAMKEVCVFE